MSESKIADLKVALEAFDVLRSTGQGHVYVIHDGQVHCLELHHVLLINPNVDDNEGPWVQLFIKQGEIWVRIEDVFDRRVEAEYALAHPERSELC